VAAIKKNAKSWTCKTRESVQWEVPELTLEESFKIEKLTMKKRTANQIDSVVPKAPKLEAKPGEAGAAAKPRAKPKGGPKPLSEAGKNNLTKLEMSVSGWLQDAEHEMDDFNPDNNPIDAEVPKRFVTNLKNAMTEAQAVDEELNKAIAEDCIQPGTTLAALRLRASTALSELETALDRVKNSRAD